MSSVFSHIVQKRFSQQYEDVATDALAYILASDAPLQGMMKLLRGIVSDLPPLRFRTQQAEGSIRPDMWGFAENEPRVFVENKFWAGLTDNQPVDYLRQLARSPKSTLLVVIAPAKREYTLQRELSRRLHEAGISFSEGSEVAGVAWSAVTEPGPVLALTSWNTVLSILEQECVDDPRARADLLQLGALCDAADVDAFIPFSAEEASDQRSPALVLQLGSIVQATVDAAVSKGVLTIAGLRPQAHWGRIGRYVRFGGEQGCGAWLGIHFRLWKIHGTTPLWLKFSDSGFGRAKEVRPLMQSWATRTSMFAVDDGRDVAIALRVRDGEDKAGVVQTLMSDLQGIASIVAQLPPSIEMQPPDEP